MTLFGLSRPRAAVAVAILAVICATGSWLTTHSGITPELHSGDAKEYAIMARRLASGQGFTTSVIYPAELGFGSDLDHPAVMRPPFWPMLLALGFKVTGPTVATAHGLVLLSHIVAVGASAALGWLVAGPGIAAIAAVVTALTPQLTALTVDPISEPLFAALTALAFLLTAARRSPALVGAMCGLAYLTRYNGAVLLPALVLPLIVPAKGETFSLPHAVRTALAAGVGFLAVTAPWWIRNWLVTGDPFFTLLSLNFDFTTEQAAPRSSLYYMLEPDLTSTAAMSPWEKAPKGAYRLIANWPLLAANFAAFVGLTLAGIKRDFLGIAFLVVAVITAAAISVAMPNGRYFVPLIPVLIPLGAAGWLRHGGRLAMPMLALVLLGPVLPSIPGDLPDIRLARGYSAHLRSASPRPTPTAPEKLKKCLAGNPVVIAANAPDLAWKTGAIAIYQPSRAADFWRILEDHPVRFLHSNALEFLEAEELTAAFQRRPDCDAQLWERR